MNNIYLDYPKQVDVIKDDSVYADYVNHCLDYKAMWVNDSKSSTAHECTHGINSRIRNSNFQAIKSYGNLAEPVPLITRIKTRHGYLPQPIRTSYEATGPKVNGFYVGKSKGIVLLEPDTLKEYVCDFVPRNLRGSRYDLYIKGQRAWNDYTLYIIDELVAYKAGTLTAIDQHKRGDNMQGSDHCMGPVEFMGYTIAMCVMIEKKDPEYFQREPKFLPFIKQEIIDSVNAFYECNKLIPWDTFGTLVKNLREADTLNGWLKDKFGFVIPDGPFTESKLSREDFMIL